MALLRHYHEKWFLLSVLRSFYAAQSVFFALATKNQLPGGRLNWGQVNNRQESVAIDHIIPATGSINN
jgi:hypothetical protein